MKNIFKNKEHRQEQNQISEVQENSSDLIETDLSSTPTEVVEKKESNDNEIIIIDTHSEKENREPIKENNEEIVNVPDNDEEVKLSKKERKKRAKNAKKNKYSDKEEVSDKDQEGVIQPEVDEYPNLNTEDHDSIDDEQTNSNQTQENDEQQQDEQKKEADDDEKSADESEEEKKAREKKERNAEKKAKRKAWVKAHRKLIAILSAILIVVIGVTVTHFVITRNVYFIHNEEDLIKIAAKEKNSRTNLILKNDVTVNGDYSINNCNLDLNKYTLTIKGNLTLSNKDNCNIGKQKTIWSDYKQGGNIIVEGDFILNGLSYNLMSDIKADSVLIYADEANIDGKILSFSEEDCKIYFKRNKAGEVIVSDYSKNNGFLAIRSTIKGNIYLSMESELALYGKINSIYGGAKVTLYSGSTSSMVSDCKKLYIQPYADWISFDKITVEEYYFVEKLEMPTLLFVNDNDEQYLRISNVENADAYILVYDGSEEIRIEKKLGDKYTEYKLPYKAPGDYKLTLYAISDNSDKYLNGDSVTMAISIYSKLSTPIILGCEEIIDDEGTKTVLRIQNTPHATQYYIEINYKGIEVEVGEDEVLTVDITEYVADPGISNIFVTAKATGTNYNDSDKELFSYVKTQKLVFEWLTANIVDDEYVVAWSEPKGAQAYEISVYDENGTLVQHYITVSTSITLDEVADVRIRPLGSGYYKDGDEIKVSEDMAIERDVQE